MLARPLLSEASLAALQNLSWEDPARAERLLDGLARRAGTPPEAGALLDRILERLPEAPDPEMALLNLERWVSRLTTPASVFALLVEHPRLLDDLLRLFGASQYLSDVLARDPWLYAVMLEPDGTRAPEEYAADVKEPSRDLLRRVKRREYLRIGWRDLTGRAPLEETVRDISNLADALIAAALRVAEAEVAPRFATAAAHTRFAVIAMGKLGARELNYSSDIDLVFIMDAPDPRGEAARRYATRLAEVLIRVLADDTAEGRCFRVDMRLRPEGRSGALVRSYAAFREYYDRWAETWERQALIKARAVAGDPDLGRRFVELVQPVIYRKIQGPAVLEDVREMRSAVEARLLAAGEWERNVKEGRGTIRDVEFGIQLLQLLFGADHPELRVPDTLTALERLEHAGVLIHEERAIFEAGYRFFREVEHRLQLMNDLPVRLIPTEPRDLERLARAMGARDASAFLEEVRRRAAGVRGLAESMQARLGARATGPAERLRSALLLAYSESGESALRAELEERGFPEPERAASALVHLAVGPPGNPHPSATRRLFADLAPSLLDACAESADPTGALVGVDQLAQRKLLYRQFFQTLSEHPEGLRDLCRFAGGAPAVLKTVLRFPELADLLTDQELLSQVRTPWEMDQDLQTRLALAPSYERCLSVLRRFKLRELVRLSARHVLQPVPPEVETAEWSELADVVLRRALQVAAARLRETGRWSRAGTGRFAVLALGRYGGRELHFSSDLDLLYVSEPVEGITQQQYEQLAAELGIVLQAVTDEGPLFPLDLRLRPEGRSGFSVVSLEAARRYYGEGGRAETWEFQTLTRLRPVTGDLETAERFRDLVAPRVYRSPMPEEWSDQIRRMKRRIERERVSDADRPRHLKLGPGGLSDIEFLVQYLQLARGLWPEVRTPGTLPAIEALLRCGSLTAEQARTLSRGFRFLTRLRQTLFLLGRGDMVHADAVLARAAGFGSPEGLDAAYREHTRPVRAIFEEYLGKEKPAGGNA